MLTGFDEYPFHQITQTFAGVAGSDPSWNDGHYVCAADQAGVKLGIFFQDRFKPGLIRVKEFLDAGIHCEIRKCPFATAVSAIASQAELWLQNDQDCHRAFRLCVQLGIGFARRNQIRRSRLDNHLRLSEHAFR